MEMRTRRNRSDPASLLKASACEELDVKAYMEVSMVRSLVSMLYPVERRVLPATMQ